MKSRKNSSWGKGKSGVIKTKRKMPQGGRDPLL